MTRTRPLLIQVISQLRPTRCGVSDYALSLARELESCFGIDTAIAVVNSTEPCQSRYPRIYRPQTELLEICRSLSEGGPGTVLVHLSGYGFSRDGAPSVLAESLSRVKESGQFQIAVYFHELYATGMPWRSAFWHSKRQKAAVRAIAATCDLLVTNTGRHAEWLERETVRHAKFPIQRLPVSSNVGEADELTPFARRRLAMVVFGMAATRRKAYQRLRSMASVVRKLRIEEILDVGPEFNAPAQAIGIPVRRMGILPELDLGRLLSECRFGLVQHAPHGLAKSGVFAGFTAHGTVPVLGEPFAGSIDGLQDGVHLISPRTFEAASESGLDRCAAAAWQWYKEHRIHAHAACYARLFPSSSAVTDQAAAAGSQTARS